MPPWIETHKPAFSLGNLASSFARFAVSADNFHRKDREELAKDRNVSAPGSYLATTFTCSRIDVILSLIEKRQDLDLAT